jgi:hypothetical protein
MLLFNLAGPFCWRVHFVFESHGPFERERGFRCFSNSVSHCKKSLVHARLGQRCNLAVAAIPKVGKDNDVHIVRN